MATIASNMSRSAPKRQNFLQVIGSAIVAHMERRSRTEQIRALQAKSDAELKRLGITRAEIPSFVFRDLFYL